MQQASNRFSRSASLLGVFLCAFSALILTSSSASAVEVPYELKGVGITEHLGDSVLSKDLQFKDETGQVVHLSQYFKTGKPVILVLAYYECPNLCTFVLNGLADSLAKMDWLPGKQFEVVTLSINPKETPALAVQKKAAYMAKYGKPEAAAGWHFLTGEESQIHPLADAVGFGYKWDSDEKQYAHSAVLYTLTPDGRISRYLYGIEFMPKDLKLGLLEASNGKIGTIVDRFMLFCYRYDPKTRKYSVYLTKVMQTGCAVTLVVFGGYMAVFWRKQRRIYKKKEPNLHV